MHGKIFKSTNGLSTLNFRKDHMTNDECGDLIFPGDYIATSEEYIPGEGTYEEDGNIFSALIGSLNLNRVEMLAVVLPRGKCPVYLKDNDVVIGRVTKILKGYVFVEIYYSNGNERKVTGETNARLHISRISGKYIKDAMQAFSENDIIRAVVISTEPSLEISTARDDLGIIKSACHGCGETFTVETGKLTCTNCEIILRRKIAGDYGEWQI